MLEESQESLLEIKVSQPQTHTGEILVAAAALCVLVLTVYLTLFDNITFR